MFDEWALKSYTENEIFSQNKTKNSNTTNNKPNTDNNNNNNININSNNNTNNNNNNNNNKQNTNVNLRAPRNSLIQDVAFENITVTKISSLDELLDRHGKKSLGNMGSAKSVVNRRRSICCSDMAKYINNINASTLGPEILKTNDLLMYPFSDKERESLYDEDLFRVNNFLPVVTWAESLELSLDEESDLQYTDFAEKLALNLNFVQNLRKKSLKAIETLDSLSLNINSIKTQTDKFMSTCSNLSNDINHLDNLVKDIDENLKPFNSLEKISSLLNRPGADLVKEDSFISMLKELDYAIDFTKENSNFKNVDIYSVRLRQCMTRALSLIKVFITKLLREISNDVQSRISSEKFPNNDATRTTLLYSPFQIDAPLIKKLLLEIKTRAKQFPEYESLLDEIFKAYFSIRSKFLIPIIRVESANILSQHANNIQSLVRVSLIYIRSVCEDEYKLFNENFSQNDETLYSFLTQLYDQINDTLRQKIIHESRIDTLCELCSLLQTQANNGVGFNEEEVNGFQDHYSNHGLGITNQSASGFKFNKLTLATLQDLRSRLIFKVQSYVDKEIAGYIPKESDVRRIGFRKSKRSASFAGSYKENDSHNNNKQSEKNLINEEKSLIQNSSFENIEQLNIETGELFEGAYLPLQRSISLLIRIYRLLDTVVFDDLAHHIVHVCILSLEKAFQLTQLDRKEERLLFLIKNFLILKDQIVTFDIEYAHPEYSLDFSGLATVFREIRERSSELLSYDNLIKLAKVGMPKVVENMPDAQHELDEKLRTAVNDFTMTCSNSISECILIDKIKQEKEELTTEIVDEKFLMFRKTIESEFPWLKHQVEDYISDLRTGDILINAIQDLVSQNYEDFYNYVLDRSKIKIDILWEVDAFISWMGMEIGKLHKEENSGEISPISRDFPAELSPALSN